MEKIPGAHIIKFKRGRAATWRSLNLVLDDGEPGLERDTGKLKFGDGETPWNDLPYFSGSSSDAATLINNHINSLLPHPVYDDGPSLVLLYENAKV